MKPHELAAALNELPPADGQQVNDDLPTDFSPIKHIEEPTFKTTAGKLRRLVASNPDHPKSAAFRKAVKGMVDDYPVVVEQIDLQAILENRDVLNTEEERVIDDEKVIVHKKKLGAVLKKAAAAPPPPPPKDPPKKG